jgi:hypothetical protein
VKKKRLDTTSGPESKKKHPYRSVIVIATSVVVIFLGLTIYRLLFSPPIIAGFICGDYCPGPQQQYNVQVYEGVRNRVHCMLLGGKYHVISGWGEQKVCIVR